MKILQSVTAPLAPLSRVLDFGAGDGYFASQFYQMGIAQELVAVDVQARDDNFYNSMIYDGTRLPFGDASFDLVYAVDVLHHCPDPRASLRDLLRCSSRYFLLKDHNYHRLASWLLLCCLDEIGNRRFGIPCRYQHQRRWEWDAWIEEAGFQRTKFIHPAPCHSRFYDRMINAYEFVALWQRV